MMNSVTVGEGVVLKIGIKWSMILPKQTVEYLQSMKKIMTMELTKPMAATKGQGGGITVRGGWGGSTPEGSIGEVGAYT